MGETRDAIVIYGESAARDVGEDQVGGIPELEAADNEDDDEEDGEEQVYGEHPSYCHTHLDGGLACVVGTRHLG